MSQHQRKHIPNWLRRLRGWQETPDWLLELIHKGSEFSFVELGARPEEAGFAPDEDLAADDETELSALRAWERAQPAPELPAAEADEVPSDKDVPEEEGAAPPSSRRHSGVTDWLHELDDDGSVEAAATHPAEMRQRSGWTEQLDELAGDTPTLEIEPGSEEEEAEPPARRSGITDWLSRLDEEPPEAAGAGPRPSSATPKRPAADEDQAAPGPGGELPDWLSGLQAPAPEGGTGDEDIAGEVPDWLADLEAGPAGEEDLSAGQGTGIPPWLTALEGEEPEQEVPDWLADLDSGGGIAAWLSEQEETALPPEAGGPEGEGEAPEEAAAQPLPGPSAELDEAALEEAGLQEDQLPDWLRGIDETTGDEPPQETPVEPTDGETPDWLLALGEVAGEQEPVSPAEPTEDETPDWLHALEEAVEDQEAAPQEEGPTALVEDETPDWLRALDETAEEHEAAPRKEGPTAPAEDETPDWLRALDKAAEDQEAAPREEGETALVEDETPDWLLALDEIAEEQEAAPREEGETPDWLRALDEAIGERRSDAEPEAGVLGEPEQAGGAEEQAGEEEMPDWLRDLAIDERGPEAGLAPEAGVPMPDWLSLEGTPSVSPQRPADEDEGEPEEPAPPVPEWMEGIYAPKEELPAAEEALSLPPAEEWPEGEVPEWLAALGEEGAGPPRQGSAVEASGPLAGLSGVLSPEPILANFPKSAFQPIPPVPDAHQAEAELVEHALETPASRRIQVARTTGREILNSLGRWVIYGLLLAAVLIAPLRSCVRLPDFGETRTFYNAIERLPSGSAVLVAFDYDASLDGTLTPQARAILWHLQRQDLGIVLLSLTPQGAAIAEDLIAENEGMVAGRDYVDLGYLPPHPASLLAFMSDPLGGATRFGDTEDPAGTVLGRQIRTFADLDMIITITGDRDHIRWWIEQVQPRTEIELLAAVPAAITPYVEPYYSELGTGQVAGILGGLGPTAQYEELLQADFIPSARLSYVVQTNALLLFTGVVLVSGLGSLLGSLSRRGVSGKKGRRAAGGVE